jgi:hypothetical protein
LDLFFELFIEVAATGSFIFKLSCLISFFSPLEDKSFSLKLALSRSLFCDLALTFLFSNLQPIAN